MLLDENVKDEDPELPPEKSAMYAYLQAQIADVVLILNGSRDCSSSHFCHLMDDWLQTLAKQTGKGPARTFGLTFDFFTAHNRFIDSVDGFIIESLCAKQLTRQLDAISTELGEKVFGLGLAILSYHATGFYLGISGEYACELSYQGLLLREKTPYELAWHAFHARMMLGAQETAEFTLTHRIPDKNIHLPPIQVLQGPILQVGLNRLPVTLRLLTLIFSSFRIPVQAGSHQPCRFQRTLTRSLI